MRLLSALSLLSLATFSYGFANPEPVTGDIALHSPTMCKDNAGTYFIFSGSSVKGIEIRTSPDRIAWTLIGEVWPNGAPWVDQFTKGKSHSQWAPDCTYLNGEFILYYAASTSGSKNSAIFLAKSSTGMPGSWTNEGIVNSTSQANIYNAIDPNLLIDGNRWLLNLGSFFSGIKAIDINPSTGLRAGSSIASLAKRTADHGAIEASTLFKFNNFYYLFSSWDRCCRGINSTYNIRVGRSTSPTGGFVDQSGKALLDGGGTLVLHSHGNITGPGGEDVMMDDDGPIMVYHYYNLSGTFLGINKLDFSSGWPVVV